MRKLQPSVLVPLLTGTFAFFAYFYSHWARECEKCEVCELQLDTVPPPLIVPAEVSVREQNDKTSEQDSLDFMTEDMLGASTLLNAVLSSGYLGDMVWMMAGGVVVTAGLVATTVSQPLLLGIGFVALNFVPALILSVPLGLLMGSALLLYWGT